jgi:hypothetical protein
MLAGLTLGLAGCRASSPAARPTTERERDSAIGASQLQVRRACAAHSG